MPHDWLCEHCLRTNGFYEEVEVDHKATDPLLRALKKAIRLQPDRVQWREVWKALPGFLGWERFVEAWKPRGRRFARLLFERQEKYFPDTSVPLLYRPKDTCGKTSWSPSLGPCCCGAMRIMGQSSWSSSWTTLSRCPWNMPARPSTACCGARTGPWLCPHSPLKPRSHRRRTPKSLDHWWLSSVVKSLVFDCVKSGVHALAREGSLSPRGGLWGNTHTHWAAAPHSEETGGLQATGPSQGAQV